jgi:phosphatidylserine decarboxylase
MEGIVRGGRKILLLVWGVTLAGAVLGCRCLELPFLVVGLLLLYIYRNPARPVGKGIVSPVDGEVIEVKEREGQVVAKMGIWDCKSVRAPFTGKVKQERRVTGLKLSPTSPLAPILNSRVEWELEGEKGEQLKVEVMETPSTTSISLYRNRFQKGEPIGEIDPTALISLYLPGSPLLKVVEFQHLKAGLSTLATSRFADKGE